MALNSSLKTIEKVTENKVIDGQLFGPTGNHSRSKPFDNMSNFNELSSSSMSAVMNPKDSLTSLTETSFPSTFQSRVNFPNEYSNNELGLQVGLGDGRKKKPKTTPKTPKNTKDAPKTTPKTTPKTKDTPKTKSTPRQTKQDEKPQTKPKSTPKSKSTYK